jgi:hypothetical protein
LKEVLSSYKESSFCVDRGMVPYRTWGQGNALSRYSGLDKQATQGFSDFEGNSGGTIVSHRHSNKELLLKTFLGRTFPKALIFFFLRSFPSDNSNALSRDFVISKPAEEVKISSRPNLAFLSCQDCSNLSGKKVENMMITEARNEKKHVLSTSFPFHA